MAFAPAGQSFTLSDPTLTSFGFQFQSFNADRSNTPITFSLRSGAGLGGASIYSQSLRLPATLPAPTGILTDFSLPNLVALAFA